MYVCAYHVSCVHKHMYPSCEIRKYFVEIHGFIPQEAFSLLALRALQRAAVDPPPPMSRGGKREMFRAPGMKHGDKT